MLTTTINTGQMLLNLSLKDGYLEKTITTRLQIMIASLHLVQGKVMNPIYLIVNNMLTLLRSRNCIGKNFALQELRLALANFFKYYEIKPIPKEMKEAENLRQYLTLTVAKGSFLAKVKRRTEAPLSTL